MIQNTIIVTIDDDQTYSKHMVRDLVKQYFYRPEAVFTGFGLNFFFAPNHSMYAEPVVLDGSQSLLVVGAGGVAYKRKFFKNDIFLLLDNKPLNCFLTPIFAGL